MGWPLATTQPAMPVPGRALARTLLPAAPLLVLVGGATWLVQAQDLLWPLLVANDPDRSTGPVALLLSTQRIAATGEAPLGLALPIAAVVIATLALAAAQVLYLDRLAIRTDRL
jgi:ABC-type glycerol-3-phosphate transport system permease component